MPPTLMLFLCAVLVAVLIYIERKGNPSMSLAVWIPTFYMLILGSRPVGSWFGKTDIFVSSYDVEAGSPLDQYVLIMLILLALLVLFRRKIEWFKILNDNFALISLYIFLAISILWSDNMFLSFKRWIKLLATIPIAMVVLSDRAPFAALESVFRRCVYVLVPFSIILAKYYPYFGVSYSRWSGFLSWNGVTLTKNALAHLCLVSSIFIIWTFLKDRRIRDVSKNKLITLVDGLILTFTAYLLFGGPGGSSATSTAVFFIAIFSLFLLYRTKNRTRQLAAFLSFSAVLAWLILIFSESFTSVFTSLLGRDQTFTGRIDIWAMALRDAALHPILGTGFGNYFATENEFSRTYGFTGHNGLLDVYVELGVVGVIFVLIFLFSFYRRVLGELDHSFDWGVLGICLLVISLLTNYTESLFLKSSSYIWGSMILLTIVFSAPRLNTKEYNLSVNNASPPS